MFGLGWLKRAVSPVKTTTIQQGSFAFRGQPGHDYDTWSWPHFPANNQYTFFNAVPGNILPSFNKYVTQNQGAGAQLQPSWTMPSNSEQPNAWIRGHSGLQALRFGQNQSARYVAAQSASWQTLYYNGGID